MKVLGQRFQDLESMVFDCKVGGYVLSALGFWFWGSAVYEQKVVKRA
jgi:hypothetical protein